jgi:zinc protease
MLFGQTLATGGSVDDIEYWPSHIDGVTMDQVEAVAKKYLDPDNFNRRPYLTGVLLPSSPGAKGSGHVSLKPQSEVMQ